MIQKDNLNFSTIQRFLAKKISADKNNTTYRTGSLHSTPVVGEPDVMWESVVYIASTRQIWTHGTIYGVGEYIPATLHAVGQRLFIKCAEDSLLSTDKICVGRYYSRRVKFTDGDNISNWRKKSWAIPDYNFGISIGDYKSGKYFINGSQGLLQKLYNFTPQTLNPESPSTIHSLLNKKLGICIYRNGIPMTDWMPFSINYCANEENEQPSPHYTRWK